MSGESHSSGQMVVVDEARGPALVLRDDGMYQMSSQTELLRVAGMLLKTQAVPKSFCTPAQVAVAVQALISMGLNPYVSIRQTGFINGAFTIFGDLPMALVRKTNELEDFEEFLFVGGGPEGGYRRQSFDNGNCHEAPIGAVCRLKRRHHSVHEVVFTVNHAKEAGLWGKPGPWSKFPARMMMMRARSQAIKDVFADRLLGVAIQEFDVEGIDHTDTSSQQAGRERGIVVSRRLGDSQEATLCNLKSPPAVGGAQWHGGVQVESLAPTDSATRKPDGDR